MCPSDPIQLQRSTQVPRALLVELYSSVGWVHYARDPERLERAIVQSAHVVTAWRGAELLGLARVVSDDVSIAYLQDILVRPEAQGQGIGKRLLGDCLERFAHVRQKVLLTDDDPRQLGFYASMGFANTRELRDVHLNAFVRIEGAKLR